MLTNRSAKAVLELSLGTALLALALASHGTAYAQTPAPTPASETAKKSWTDSIKLSGFIQAQYVATEDSGDGVDLTRRSPQNKDRFEIRRARLKLTFSEGPAEAMLHIDALPTGFRLLEAEAGGKIKWQGDAYTRLTAGLFRVPFGWELLESMSVHPFPERSLWAQHLFPGVRDIGARIAGAAWGDRLVYHLAVMNGHPISDAATNERDSAFPGTDLNAEKDFAGRIGTQLKLPVGGLRFGVSGLVGTGYIKNAADDAATPEDESHGPIEFGHWAAGADLVLTFDVPVLGELGLYSEAVLASNLDRLTLRDYPDVVLDASGDATDDVTDRDAMGFYVGFLQHLGELFALGARYDLFDRDTDTDDDTISAVTFVGHAYPAGPIRLTVAYDLRIEEPSVKNNQFWLRAQVKY